ncbi:spore coat protein [Eubacteriales bacterium mix99]
MNMTLTQKEQALLKDQQTHEKICIKKYNNYADHAQDPELKQMFRTYAGQEQQHLNTLDQMMNGQVPNMQQNQQGQQNQQAQQSQQSQQNQLQSQSQQQAGKNPMDNAMQNQSDADLCNDMLMTEKYVSDAYNTAVFEFVNTDARQALNHIQKEEQQHGEGIFNYMNKNGMYQVQ